MATYIVADPQFFNAKAAQKTGLSIEEYNSMIVAHCNQIATENDFIYFMGEISDGNFEETQRVIKSIKAQKTIMDFTEKKLSRNQWNEMGVKTININGFVKGKINGKEKSVIILASKKGFAKILSTNPCAAPYSLPVAKTLFNRRILNLSMDHWAYYPVKYDDIPYLLEGQRGE